MEFNITDAILVTIQNSRLQIVLVRLNLKLLLCSLRVACDTSIKLLTTLKQISNADEYVEQTKGTLAKLLLFDSITIVALLGS